MDFQKLVGVRLTDTDLAQKTGRFSSAGLAILMARDQGYATADEEFGLGLMGVSAPVRDHTGRIVAAINVSATRSQIGGRINEIGAVVEAAADDLSEALGFVIAPLRRVTGPA